MVLKINFKTVVIKYDFKVYLKSQLMNKILKLIFKTMLVTVIRYHKKIALLNILKISLYVFKKNEHFILLVFMCI